MNKMNGEWVILKDDDIVEHNKDAKIILEIAENRYKDIDITIAKIPSAESCFY